jgi:hypothetical protein
MVRHECAAADNVHLGNSQSSGQRRAHAMVQVDDLKCSIKFQLKKVLCMGVAVAHVGMSERDIYVNTQARNPFSCVELASVLAYMSTRRRARITHMLAPAAGLDILHTSRRCGAHAGAPPMRVVTAVRTCVQHLHSHERCCHRQLQGHYKPLEWLTQPRPCRWRSISWCRCSRRTGRTSSASTSRRRWANPCASTRRARGVPRGHRRSRCAASCGGGVA